MATRGSPMRAVPGSPLAGVLRASARNARSTTRRSVSVPGPEGATGDAGPPGTGAVACTYALVSDDDGNALWVFPEALQQPPVVSVAAVAPVGAVLCSLATVDVSSVAVRVQHFDTATGGFVPAAGVRLHAVAYL